MTMRALVAGFTALLVLGCGGNEGGSCPAECPPCQTCFYGTCIPDLECTDAGFEGDATPDMTDSTDVPPDAPVDAPVDLPPEITPDVLPDLPFEITPDVRPDVRPDVTPETEVRPEADGRPEADVTTGRNTGEPCSSAAECRGPGADCITTLPDPYGGTWTWPGGYCTSDCDADGTCGAGGYCADGTFVGLPRMCVKPCTVETECRTAEGYICSNYYFFEPFCGPPL